MHQSILRRDHRRTYKFKWFRLRRGGLSWSKKPDYIAETKLWLERRKKRWVHARTSRVKANEDRTEKFRSKKTKKTQHYDTLLPLFRLPNWFDCDAFPRNPSSITSATYQSEHSIDDHSGEVYLRKHTSSELAWWGHKWLELHEVRLKLAI